MRALLGGLPNGQGRRSVSLVQVEIAAVRRRPLFAAVVAVGMMLLTPLPAFAQHAPPWDFADLAAKLLPSVVNISARSKPVETKKEPQEAERGPSGSPFEEFFREFMERNGQGEQSQRRGVSVGSGFVIDAEKGYVVTNNHVISPAQDNATVDSITVTLSDRKEYQAKLIGRDTAMDLAVLKINAGGNLPFVKFGDSTRTRVGDWVIAIGNPFGLGGTVTAGIVSALHRNINAGLYDRYIQTDASINMGNSGGPMFDLNGNVIGINTALISPTGGNVGVGFAIPAEQVKPVIDALRAGTRPQRGYLGVAFQQIDENIADSLNIPRNRGELIRSVTPGGPAARAGIQQGDVIVTINNRPVTPAMPPPAAALSSMIRPPGWLELLTP